MAAPAPVKTVGSNRYVFTGYAGADAKLKVCRRRWPTSPILLENQTSFAGFPVVA